MRRVRNRRAASVYETEPPHVSAPPGFIKSLH